VTEPWKIPVTYEGRKVADATITEDGKVCFQVKDDFLLDELTIFGLPIESFIPLHEPSANERLHILIGGGVGHDFSGNKIMQPDVCGFAKCSCGEMSDKAYLSYYRRQRWHKSHVKEQATKEVA
jgi:hypothetical protein